MQNEKAEHFGRAEAHDPTVGPKSDGLAGLVDYTLGNGEHVVFVDGNDPLEHDALAIVPGKGHRSVDGQCLCIRFPQGLAVRNRNRWIGRRPAKIGVVGGRRVGRRQQGNLGAVRIDGFAIIGQRQIVDAGANQRHRSVKPFGVDDQPRHGFQCIRTPNRLGQHFLRQNLRIRTWLDLRVRWQAGQRAAGLLHRQFGCLVHLDLADWGRWLNKDLEADKNYDRQNDRYDQITLVIHQKLCSRE